jgi:putative ABC transport system permease protein
MVIGVGIALGTGMTMLAVSNAFVEVLTAEFRRSSADLYVTTRGGTLIPILPGQTTGTIRDSRWVLSQARASPGVSAALGFMAWTLERERPGPKRSDEVRDLISAIGVEGDPYDIPNMVVLNRGRWVRRADEIAVGDKLARERGIGLGDSLRLNDREFTVVGIGKLRGAGLAADSVVYMEHRALRQRANITDTFNFVVVDTADPVGTRARLAELDGLSIYDPNDLVNLAYEANQTGSVIRWIFNLLTLVIATLFVSNMLARSVAERRLEFATLRAIGMPRGTILRTVAAEALLVTLAASLVGFGVSAGLGSLLNTLVAPQYGFETLYNPDARLITIVFALAMSLGLIAGLGPARQATRVDPVEVLREA